MLRQINTKDIDEIISLELDTLSSTLGFNTLNELISNPLLGAVIIEENNNILGYVSYSYDGDILEIYNLCINKEYQRKGLGLKLMNHLFDTLKPKTSILEVKETNHRAISLYTKLGYKLLRKRKGYYNGIDALFLEKKCEMEG